MKLNEFIANYPALKPEHCSYLISVFEDSLMKQLRHENEVQQFTEVNLNQQNPELAQEIAQTVVRIAESYTDHIVPAGSRYFPQQYGLEEMRIKRYHKGDCFNQHVDVGSLGSSKRFLAFLFYLNEDFEGGATVFKTPDTFTVRPRKGNVVVFPPTWQYPHEGLMPKGKPKYIMSTYLHYV